MLICFLCVSDLTWRNDNIPQHFAKYVEESLCFRNVPENEIEIELDIKLNGRNLQMDFLEIKNLENEIKEIISKRIKMLVLRKPLCIKFVECDEKKVWMNN